MEIAYQVAITDVFDKILDEVYAYYVSAVAAAVPQ
jgi:hypothetical protein